MTNCEDVRITEADDTGGADSCVGPRVEIPWPSVRMMRQPPIAELAPMASAHATTVHLGVAAIAPSMRHHGAYQRVRRARRKAEVPRTDIPRDSANEFSEDDGDDHRALVHDAAGDRRRFLQRDKVPTKFRIEPIHTAVRGLRASAAMVGATALAVSWNPFVKSKPMATVTTMMRRKEEGTTFGFSEDHDDSWPKSAPKRAIFVRFHLLVPLRQL